jgi:hypothetical protein
VLEPGRRAQLGQLARARAARFSWERTARDVLGALERIGRRS